MRAVWNKYSIVLPNVQSVFVLPADAGSPGRNDPMIRLAVVVLLAFLPAIAAAKSSHPSSSHPKPDHVTTSHKVTKHAPTDHGSLKNVRRASAKRSFQASNPCPATGKTTGSCHGYVIDHKTPLACGGADVPSNMQWQTTAEAKLKDKTERAGCTR
jgi:hypothetical protein